MLTIVDVLTIITNSLIMSSKSRSRISMLKETKDQVYLHGYAYIHGDGLQNLFKLGDVTLFDMERKCAPV